MHDAAAMNRELGERRGREEKRRPLSTLDRPPVSLTILHLEAKNYAWGSAAILQPIVTATDVWA
jgi:hypothetical protein